MNVRTGVSYASLAFYISQEGKSNHTVIVYIILILCRGGDLANFIGIRYLHQAILFVIVKYMKRGPKPKSKIVLKWSPNFAYAMGLLVSDGCLSKDGRHIDLTSKDTEQLVAFNKCLDLNIKISKKLSGSGNVAHHIQFGDVLFYKFLLDIGLSPAKSKTISKVLIPKKYFFDFLRGYFDGDGSSYSYYDPVWKNSYRFYISFASASHKYIEWLRKELKLRLGVLGHISKSVKTSTLQLKYSKREAVKIVKKMYYKKGLVFLKRKYLKISKSLSIINKGRSGVTGKRAVFRTQ